MSENIKLGIVGLGRWAKVLTAAAKTSKKIEIVAGHSRSQEKRDAYTEDFDIKTYDSLDKLLKLNEVEGVIITVPNEQHYSVAKQIAEAGKHVYTEANFNILEDGLRMQDLQKKHNITVTVGHSARLLQGIKMMKDALNSGELENFHSSRQIFQMNELRAYARYVALVP